MYFKKYTYCKTSTIFTFLRRSILVTGVIRLEKIQYIESSFATAAFFGSLPNGRQERIHNNRITKKYLIHRKFLGWEYLALFYGWGLSIEKQL